MTARSRLPIYSPPSTYGECCTGTPITGSLEARLNGKRQCLALQCRHNLITVLADDVPGRRMANSAPEWTLNGESSSHASPSCALDVANRGAQSSAATARALGCDKRRAQQLVKAAVMRLRELGVDVGEMLALLDKERAR